jgi:hypothetical protein
MASSNNTNNNTFNNFTVVHTRNHNHISSNTNNSDKIERDMNNHIDHDMNNQIENDETYYYIGEHVDGCDIDGEKMVYHYISKTRLNGRNLNTIDIFDYDLEFWPGDRLWTDVTTRNDIIINIEDV